MIDRFVYTGAAPGLRLLVLGAVHGNEKCGTAAIRRVMREIDAGQITITAGTVTFVPICNPLAYERHVRQVERNLNRYLVPVENPDCYEARLGNELCGLLEQCDRLLDLHSYTAGGPPFVFADVPEGAELGFARCFGTEAILIDWNKAYAVAHPDAPFSEEATGTTQYARRCGAVAATLECGQHDDPASIDAGYDGIRRTLAFNGMAAIADLRPVSSSRLIEMRRVIYRDYGSLPVRELKHLEAVKVDEVLALDGHGEPVVAIEPGYIVLPKMDAPVGTEWFYLGRDYGGIL